MGKYIRVFLAIVTVLGLVLLARNKAAWAADPADKTHSPYLVQGQPSVALDEDDPCEKENNRDKDKDKDNNRDKDKEKCKDKDDDDGSVKPPDDEIEACKRGDYSVGGVAVLDIRNLRGEGCLTAYLREPDPILDPLPPGAGTILSDVVVVTLPSKGANVKLCFAAPPGEEVTIYSSSGGVLTPLKTKVKDGTACVEARDSGNYVLVGQ